MSTKGLWVSSVGLTLLLAVAPSIAQDSKKKSAAAAPRETVAKPLTDKQRKQKEARLKKELETPWKKWLNEDVSYIITEEERKAFKQFATDEEREQFVEQFWLRRDPTPDTVENEYKEEHYRRIAYANEHYASGIPGWKSDRGRIYITFGPPDEIDGFADDYCQSGDGGGGGFADISGGKSHPRKSACIDGYVCGSKNQTDLRTRRSRRHPSGHF